MAIVEEAIRLQIATGASQLQQPEMAPEAFGLSAFARAPVRRLRQGRNGALHSVAMTEDAKGFKKEGRPGQVVKLPAPHVEDDQTKSKTAFTSRDSGPHWAGVLNNKEEKVDVAMSSLAGPEAQDYSNIAKDEHLQETGLNLQKVELDDQEWLKQWTSLRTSCFGKGKGGG